MMAWSGRGKGRLVVFFCLQDGYKGIITPFAPGSTALRCRNRTVQSCAKGGSCLPVCPSKREQMFDIRFYGARCVIGREEKKGWVLFLSRQDRWTFFLRVGVSREVNQEREIKKEKGKTDILCQERGMEGGELAVDNNNRWRRCGCSSLVNGPVLRKLL